MIIAIGGAVGAGKTTLAYKLQQYFIDAGVKSLVIDNDVERRKYLGYGINYLTTSKDYTPDINHKILDICYQKAIDVIKLGGIAIIPMGFWIKEYRDNIKELADSIDANFLPIWLDVEIEEVKRRIIKRLDEKASKVEQKECLGHASDGNIEVLEKHVINMPAQDEGWLIVDGNNDGTIVYNKVVNIIKSNGGGCARI